MPKRPIFLAKSSSLVKISRSSSKRKEQGIQLAYELNTALDLKYDALTLSRSPGLNSNPQRQTISSPFLLSLG